MGLWSRSLLSIYDLEDLASLDVPWWTLEAVSQVESFLKSRNDAQVFEWGSGASSLWLAKRAASVVSVEHDPSWAEAVETLLPGNGRIVQISAAPRNDPLISLRSRKRGYENLDFTTYATSINDLPGLFDLIVIDGRAREGCLPHALGKLKPDGLVVFDNVERSRYRAAISDYRGRLDIQWTKGVTPCLPYPSQTALIRCKQE